MKKYRWYRRFVRFLKRNSFILVVNTKDQKAIYTTIKRMSRLGNRLLYIVDLTSENEYKGNMPGMRTTR